MKAIIINQFGGPEQLILQELPTPKPGPGEVLIRVEVAGVNFGDTIIRSGTAGVPMTSPMILGSEAAGRVEDVGEATNSNLLGRRVFAAPFAIGRLGGGYASHMVLPAEGIFPLPDAVTYEQSIALGVAGVTALNLAYIVPVAGRVLLVHAAAGGVGHLLAQLLQSRNPSHLVVSVGDADKTAMLAALGLRAVVNIRHDWVSQLHEATEGLPPDVIYDAIGGEVSREGLAALAPGGHFIAYGGASGAYAEMPRQSMPAFVMNRQSMLGYSMVPLLGRPDTGTRLTQHFDELYAATESGRLKTVVGQRFPLESAAAAHRLIESRRSTGKVLLTPNAEGD